jgi:hypothetical protein
MADHEHTKPPIVGWLTPDWKLDNFAGQAVDDLIGTLANNNILIDQTIRGSHDIMSSYTFDVGEAVTAAGDGGGGEIYYNSALPNEGFKSMLCGRNNLCAEEQFAYNALLYLSIPVRAFGLHLLVVMICTIAYLLCWVSYQIIALIERQVATKPVDESKRWSKVFQSIVNIIWKIGFGVGSKTLAYYFAIFYGISIAIWFIIHGFLCMTWPFDARSDYTVSEFNTEPKVQTFPGVLYSIRLPGLSSEWWQFLLDPWKLTPMAARDNALICKSGYKPSAQGAARRKKLSQTAAKENGWSLADDTDFKGGNVMAKLKYITSGQYDDSFDKKCQAKKDIVDFVGDVGGKIVDEAVKIGDLFKAD